MTIRILGRLWRAAMPLHVAVSLAAALGLAGSAWLLAAAADAKPVPRDLDLMMPGDLKAGEYRWHPERSPAGPVVVVINVDDQFATIYRNGIRIGVSTVSTGKTGHDTPTGVFTILEKKEKHESNIYKGAKMPYMHRLTWSGIALHAGNLPGYPASHGCIRFPMEFSKLLYTVTDRGGTVVIANGKADPAVSAASGALLVPEVQGDGKTGRKATPAAASSADFWKPEAASKGPVSILMSAKSRRLYVYRNGVAIGETGLTITGEGSFGERVYTLLEGVKDTPSPYVPDKPALAWMAVSLAPGAPASGEDIRARVQVPEAFARNIYDLITPGTTLFVTDAAATAETHSGTDFTVMSSDAVPDAGK